MLELAEQGLKSTGWDGISLVSLSTADYTQLEPLAEALNKRFAGDKISIALPSLRADRFGVGIADKVREVKKTGFTFAPEAGSERLRRAVNKLITDEEFFAAARIAYERGWRLIKLYMMIGLPTETMEDVEGIVHFTEKIREIGRTYGTACKVNVSVGPFVPKSHTPFQWDAFESIESQRQKIGFLRSKIPNRWSRLKWHEVETSHIEAVLSRGDRRLARTIYRAWELGGRYDGWTEHFSHERWLRALEDTDLSPEMFTRAYALDEPLPWDHIDIGVLKKFLVRERQKTDTMGETPDCRHGDCVACGIPGMPTDTRLTAPLDEAAVREMVDRAEERSPRRSENGVVWPVRIRFAKEGPARFLSHLETGTILERAFRMAEIPVGHTQGHSPHPRFHFGPPLSVGIASTAELIDVELQTPWRRDFAERLNAVLPGGYRILDARVLPSPDGTKRKSLSAEAILGVYEGDLSRLDGERQSKIAADLARFHAAEDWIVRKSQERVPDATIPKSWEGIFDRFPAPPEVTPDLRTVDLKQGCIDLAWDAERAILHMTLRLIDPAGQTANPARVLAGDLRARSRAAGAMRRHAHGHPPGGWVADLGLPCRRAQADRYLTTHPDDSCSREGEEIRINRERIAEDREEEQVREGEVCGHEQEQVCPDSRRMELADSKIREDHHDRVEQSKEEARIRRRTFVAEVQPETRDLPEEQRGVPARMLSDDPNPVAIEPSVPFHLAQSFGFLDCISGRVRITQSTHSLAIRGTGTSPECDPSLGDAGNEPVEHDRVTHGPGDQDQQDDPEVHRRVPPPSGIAMSAGNREGKKGKRQEIGSTEDCDTHREPAADKIEP